MTNFSSAAQGFGSNPYQANETAASMGVGALAVSSDGRKFRYTLAGGTSLVVGKLQQCPAEITDHQGLTAAATAIDARVSVFTLGATLASVDQYAGGLLIVTITPGVGYSYGVSGHAAVAASGSMTCNLSDPVQVALTSTSRLDLVLNPWSGVIVHPTTKTGVPVGVAIDVVTNAKYGWIQSGGAVGCLSDGATAVGAFVSPSTGVAGSIIDATHASESTVGNAITGIADTDYGAIYLTID